jgi:Protein of unknown function (DUF2500)
VDMDIGIVAFLVLFGVVFMAIVGAILFAVAKGGAQWRRNNHSPITTVAVTVATKRAQTSGGGGDAAASTSYYATFELQTGERLELAVRGAQFGQIAERDTGQLTYQGTRFKNFTRTA